MDRKSVIILVVCAILFFAWAQITSRLYPPRPMPRTNVLAAATNTIAGASNSATAGAGNPTLTLEHAHPDVPEELVVLTNEMARYTFTSHGGGLKLVELLKYPESVNCNRRLTGVVARVATLNGQAQQPVLAQLGGEGLTGDGAFKLSRYTRAVPAGSNSPARSVIGVRAEKTLTNGLQVMKEFEPGEHYLIEARVRMDNRGGQTLILPPEVWVAGTATPLNAQDDESLVGVHWYDGSSDTAIGRPYFDNKTLGCFPGTPRAVYQAIGRPVAWATAHNQFFFIAVIPKEPAAEVSATKFSLPAPTREEIALDNRTLTNQVAFQVNLHYGATNLPAGQGMQREFTLFAGPKEYRTLERIGAVMKNDLDRVMGYGGFFGFFSRLLLLSMNGLNALGLSYGAAIIAITVIIKVLFWPLTAISTRSSKRMQLLQPQMKALQEKYKEDPVKMNKKLMEFMKEHKVSPMSGCWPVLLQFPVLIGFFKMVQSAIELRGAAFLWACDLSKSDTIWVLPGINFNVNPLPLLMGATMLWQARLMPAAPGMDPAQQKIMKYFPMVFLVILYNYSAGLTLYWTVQNLLSIAQLKLTRAADEKRSAKPGHPGGARTPASLPPKKK